MIDKNLMDKAKELLEAAGFNITKAQVLVLLQLLKAGGPLSREELAHNCTEKQCHPHFTCTNCSETFCLTGLFLPLVQGLKKGFVIHRQQVRIEGLYSSCS